MNSLISVFYIDVITYLCPAPIVGVVIRCDLKTPLGISANTR